MRCFAVWTEAADVLGDVAKFVWRPSSQLHDILQPLPICRWALVKASVAGVVVDLFLCTFEQRPLRGDLLVSTPAMALFRSFAQVVPRCLENVNAAFSMFVDAEVRAESSTHEMQRA